MPTIVTIIALVLAVVGSSFAFFTVKTGSGASSNANVTAKTTGLLIFIGGPPIGITVRQDNIGAIKTNLSSETTVKAANVLEYTEATKPELILTITGPMGVEVKTLQGRNYVTSGGVSGFDVTTTKGLTKINLDNANAKANNWLSAEVNELSISRHSDIFQYLFIINSSGSVFEDSVGNSSSACVVFYLQSSVNLNVGNGSVIDTYRV